MSSAAKIAANTANAQASTGPRTEAGKATSAKNGITHGLYTRGDFIRPQDEPAYANLQAELQLELAPIGTLEQTLADEIRRAVWRLRRCGEVEANLVIRLDDDKGYILDPMETTNANAEQIQKSVDRAPALRPTACFTSAPPNSASSRPAAKSARQSKPSHPAPCLFLTSLRTLRKPMQSEPRRWS
jgi:hypothetical protein